MVMDKKEAKIFIVCPKHGEQEAIRLPHRVICKKCYEQKKMESMGDTE